MRLFSVSCGSKLNRKELPFNVAFPIFTSGSINASNPRRHQNPRSVVLRPDPRSVLISNKAPHGWKSLEQYRRAIGGRSGAPEQNPVPGGVFPLRLHSGLRHRGEDLCGTGDFALAKWLLLSAVWHGRKLRRDPRWPSQEVPVQELSPSINGYSGNNIRLHKASTG